MSPLVELDSSREIGYYTGDGCLKDVYEMEWK